MIETIEGISHLTELEEFWVRKGLRAGVPSSTSKTCLLAALKSNIQASYNQISDLRALDTQLRPLPNLETVYLEGNPCQTNDRAGYRRKIMLALPQVKQIDAT